MKKIANFGELAYLHFAVKIYEMGQQRRVRRLFYHDPTFRACDTTLLQGPNPYKIQEAFPYGETPLCSLKEIADRCGLCPSDRVIDLGCGRGRAVFFLAHAFGCHVHGIDKIFSFIERANVLVKQYRVPRVSFSCGDLRHYDFSLATFIFFYGTTFSEKFNEELSEALQALPVGSKIVTVSAPLPGFPIVDRFSVSFPWGKAEVFIQKLLQCRRRLRT